MLAVGITYVMHPTQTVCAYIERNYNNVPTKCDYESLSLECPRINFWPRTAVNKWPSQNSCACMSIMHCISKEEECVCVCAVARSKRATCIQMRLLPQCPIAFNSAFVVHIYSQNCSPAHFGAAFSLHRASAASR